MADAGPSTSLEGKVAIVTGAGTGLGRAYARHLAAAGAGVVVNDLGVPVLGGPGDDKPGQVVAEEIRAAGGKAVAHYGDVADWDDVANMIATALDTFGRLDILVNNAGIMTPTAIIPDMEIADYDEMLRVHLRGAFCTTIQATRYWRDEYRREGMAVDRCIVNATSSSFLLGGAWRPNYAVAKAGVATLTMGTAAGCGWFGVRANGILPTAQGRMSAVTSQAAHEAMADKQPDDNAPLIVALAGPAGAGITGQLFNVVGTTIRVIAAPQISAVFYSDQKWTSDEVARQLKEHFSIPRQGYAWAFPGQMQDLITTLSGDTPASKSD
jgi:3-oxoacyl-[acyl-carrier protein] reductase